METDRRRHDEHPCKSKVGCGRPAAASTHFRSRVLRFIPGIVGEIADQPLQTRLEVAAALQCEQYRCDMLRRLAMEGAIMIDIELVNRYTVLKRSGAI
jgi:hypothetical protein